MLYFETCYYHRSQVIQEWVVVRSILVGVLVPIAWVLVRKRLFMPQNLGNSRSLS